MADAVAEAPLLLRWQGLIPSSQPQQRRLQAVSCLVLMACSPPCRSSADRALPWW